MHNANEFLQFVADNEKRLKQNLKKNVTYDPDIFDDVFQTTIIKIYNSIVKNDLRIDNFEKYFFIGSKFEYINTDNKRKNLRNLTVDETSAHTLIEEETEDRSEEISKIYKSTEQYLKETYGEQRTEIFLAYYWLRIQTGRTSYKAISQDYEISVKDVSAIIKEINADIKGKNIKLNNLLSND